MRFNFQLSESNSLSYGNNNNESKNSSSSSTSRKVIITRKPSISDSKTEENNNNYTDLSDLKNNNNNSVTVYSENGSSSRCFEFQATVGPNGVCTMQPVGPGAAGGGNAKNSFKRYMSPPPNPQFQQFPPGKKRTLDLNGPKWAFHNSVDLPTLPYYGNFLYSVHVLSAKCLRSESHFLVGFFAATTAFIIGLATHKFSTLDSQGIHP